MLRVAVMGLGYWGPNLARSLAADGRAEVSHLVDPRHDRLGQVGAAHPQARQSLDADAVLSDPQLDAVAIATPAHTHFTLARRALEAGKHVLVEKPITCSSAEAMVLDALARQQGRVLLVGHVYLFHPAVEAVRRLIAEGALGRLRGLSMVRTNAGPVRTDVNAAWDLSSHDLSMAMHWLGAEPVSVSARGAAYLRPGVADVVSATAQFTGEVQVNLEASWLGAKKVRDITVVGERRLLTFDDCQPEAPVRLYGPGLPVSGEVVPVPKAEPLKSECSHFLDCITQGVAPRCDAPAAGAVVRSLEALELSLGQHGAWVPVAPARHISPGPSPKPAATGADHQHADQRRS